MCDIIRKKLDIESREQPVTVYSYLNLFLRILDNLSLQLNLKLVAPKLLQVFKYILMFSIDFVFE